MKKFVNHVDHVAWISRPENLEANVAALETLSGRRLSRYENTALGITVCISWEAGLENIAPTAAATPTNQELRDRLETAGEGVFAVIFGVKDLEAHKARLEALGFKVGPLMGGGPDSPSRGRVAVRERRAAQLMNSWFVLGEIDYADGLVAFEDA